MRLMIDTNIVIDVLEEREPFFADSQAVLKMCESGKIEGYFSAASVTDIFYLVRKSLGSTEAAYQALDYLFQAVGVLPVTSKEVDLAFHRRAKDFEDCLLAMCAVIGGCSGIVTRNKRDFLSFEIPLYTPEEALAMLHKT